ncbi:hypothetical protein [Paractinoplanes hotanensis]|uniref:Uncharacterized protein n=1 Tax=Paractinoplanes hotanensis TaxID=2906497 RepID=A0ABT0YCH0_9ACTN|nr:hypothetical protein [Actinoplanes hotanensis]MCM4083450.1 hypothetical protein [Actinoplanes hotanensis]
MSEDGERNTFSEGERYLNEVNDRSVFGALHGGNKVILGIRRAHFARAGDEHGIYPDRFMVLWYEGSVGLAKSFAGNTDSSAGDGRRDPGRKPAGVFLYRKEVPGSRDDRVLRRVKSLDEQESASAANGGDVMTARNALFRAGPPGRRGSAGGPALDPDLYDRFWETLGDQDDFIYVCVEE